MSTTTPSITTPTTTTLPVNPLLQEIPVKPTLPKFLKKTTPPFNSDLTSQPSIDVSKLKNDIIKRDKLILERLKLENSQIDEYIQLLQNERTTGRTNIEYDSYYITLFENIYTPLFVVYFLALLVLAYVLFLQSNEYSMAIKIMIMIIFIVYPFIIDHFEDYIISWITFFYSIIFFVPMGNNPIKTATEGQPFLYSQPFSFRQ